MKSITIYLNGETLEVSDDLTVAALLAQRHLSGRRLAVEINGTLVPRSTFDRCRLTPGDRVEIVHAVGGG